MILTECITTGVLLFDMNKQLRPKLVKKEQLLQSVILIRIGSSEQISIPLEILKQLLEAVEILNLANDFVRGIDAI